MYLHRDNKESGHAPFRMDYSIKIREDSIKEDGTFEGSAVGIDLGPNGYNEVMQPGAFDETIAKGGRNNTGIVMLYQHQTDRIPGVWTSIEPRGSLLFNAGQLALKTQLGAELYELMKMGAIKHESIGFDYAREKSGKIAPGTIEVVEDDDGNKIRKIHKIELWEISIVTFPADLDAGISNIRSIKEAKTERELERALREVGLSRTDSKYLVGICKENLRDAGELQIPAISKLHDALKSVKLGD